MMDFLLTMAVIALIFIAATIVVALLAGALIRVKDAASRRNAEHVRPE